MHEQLQQALKFYRLEEQGVLYCHAYAQLQDGMTEWETNEDGQRSSTEQANWFPSARPLGEWLG